MVGEDMPLRTIPTTGDSMSFHDVHIDVYVAFITTIAAAAANKEKLSAIFPAGNCS
jgi:hypothetical protein